MKKSKKANGMLKYRLYEASQTKSIYQYMNLKRKLWQCTANIKFNKTCIIENVIPKYAAIKVPGNTMASKITKQKAQYLRIQNEIKFLYKKKQQINKKLYISHLYNAKFWQNSWFHIEQCITNKLQIEIEKKIKNQKEKLNRISKNKEKENNNLISNNNSPFYSRLVNKTKVTFSKTETMLLEKGLKYNLHFKDKQWINRLALEADSATSLADPLQQNYLKHLVAKHIQKLQQKYSTQNYNNKKTQQEWNVLKGIKQKISNNNLVVTRADKGKTVVITEADEYK
jgi:hypothetical protein